MHALRSLALGFASALAIAGAAHADDVTPPSPAQSAGSCGSGCRYSAVTLPGGLVEVIGTFDCGAATCWNGDPVKLTWNVGASSCLSATATPYNPSDNGTSFYSAQVASRLRADGASFSAGGFQISSGTGLEGLFFRVVCRK